VTLASRPEDTERLSRIRSLIRNIPDFPQPGVQFKDITPLLADAVGFEDVIDELADRIAPDLDAICGIESRGFIFAAPLAVRLGLGFIPIRKPGKLPAPTYDQNFALEYGEGALNIHQDALRPGQRVLLIDDLLATGGTLAAAVKLIQRERAHVSQVQVVIELTDMPGRQAVGAVGVEDLVSLVRY
jgi:adenine phosphoribosyltransferase